MSRKPDSVTFYQAVKMEKTSRDNRTAYNTVDGATAPGVDIKLVEGGVDVDHKDWEYSYFVGYPNIRSIRYKKTKDKPVEKTAKKKASKKKTVKKADAK